MLYIIKNDYFMSDYILDALGADGIKIIILQQAALLNGIYFTLASISIALLS